MAVRVWRYDDGNQQRRSKAGRAAYKLDFSGIPEIIAKIKRTGDDVRDMRPAVPKLILMPLQRMALRIGAHANITGLQLIAQRIVYQLMWERAEIDARE